MAWELYEGDCLETMKLMNDGIFDLIVTSPRIILKRGQVLHGTLTIGMKMICLKRNIRNGKRCA